MIIDAIRNGIVIDHIAAGKAMELYQILGLGDLDCSVAILKNVTSGKLGRKDIIKIDRELHLDWDVIGYVDPNITVNIIKDGVRLEKRQLKLPETITGVIHCKNPRCITSVEQELPQVFKLTDREKRVYRCLYCETKALGIPQETAPLLLVRPVSGNGALAVASDLMSAYGPDSYIGRVAAVMLGSTETTFYTIAVYFGSAGVHKTRHTLPAALAADLTGFVAAALAVRLFFGGS